MLQRNGALRLRGGGDTGETKRCRRKRRGERAAKMRHGSGERRNETAERRGAGEGDAVAGDVAGDGAAKQAYFP